MRKKFFRKFLRKSLVSGGVKKDDFNKMSDEIKK